MAKKLFLAVSFFFVVQSSIFARTINLDFEFPVPHLEKKGEYFTVRMEGLSNFGNPGKPLLPLKTVKILIPNYEKIERVDVFPSEKTLLKGQYVIIPAQSPVPLSKPRWVPLSPDSQVYHSSFPFPREVHRSLKIQEFRGHSILPVSLYPVRFIPRDKAVFYYKKIRVRIKTRPILRTRAPERKLYRRLAKDKLLLMGKVDNPEAVQTYNEVSSRSPTAPLSGGGLLEGQGPYDYIIITNDALSSPFQSLIDHKIQRGLNARIVTTEWIYANYTGDDNPERIRNFIIDAYTNWGIDYVLLGGDTEVVPYRGVYAYCEGEEDFDMPCDMYYGCLDGDWDANGNGIYGEEADNPDLLAEVFVGRATVDSVGEAYNFVSKVIEYENNFDAPYHKNILLVGEKLCPPPEGYPETWGGDYKDEIAPLFPLDSTFQRLYDRDGTFNSDGYKVIDAIEEGQHLINHMGHSSEVLCMWLLQGWYMGLIYGNEVEDLTNEDLCFVYTQGCNAGAFNEGGAGGLLPGEDAIGEHFVSAQRAAFAGIFNSRYGWYSPGSTDAPSQDFDYAFWDAVFNQGITTLGKAHQAAKEANLQILLQDTVGGYRWCYYELNLFGDPESSFGGSPSRQGRVLLDKNTYRDGDTINIRVIDVDLNQNENNIDTNTLTTTVSSSSGDTEPITLQETGNNTSTFTGSIAVQNAQSLDDGTLQAAHGDTIIVTYQDADDGLGNAVVVTAEAVADFQPPSISDVRCQNVYDNLATIAWNTDELSTSRVTYGTSIPTQEVEEDTSLAFSHSVTISGLSSSTTYYYAVTSQDEAGNSITDDHGGEYYQFTTAVSTVIFCEDAESGPGVWQREGVPEGSLWHISSYRKHAGNNSWYYGIEDEYQGQPYGHYDSGARNYGHLISPDISLSESSTFLLKLFSWWSVTDSEAGSDHGSIQISEDGGSTWHTLWERFGPDGAIEEWREIVVDISAYAGNTVKLRFSFDTVDEFINYMGEGWFIDDVKVISSTEPGEIISVVVTPTNWEIGNNVNLGETKATAEDYFTATNNGNVTEDFTIVSGNSANWACGAAAGSETFVMEAKGGDLTNWTATNTSQTLKSNVAQDGTVSFGLQFTAPTASEHPGEEQSITVTITASKAIP